MSIATENIFKETLHFIWGEFFEASRPHQKSWSMAFQPILTWSFTFSSFGDSIRVDT